MATFIQTDELSGELIPDQAGAKIRDAQYGIDEALSGYIIQNASITTSRTSDTTYDQKNAVVSELDVDESQDLNMTVIGGSTEDGTLPGVEPGDTSFRWAGKNWKVRSVTYNGTYNDKKSYNINAVRYKNFPA